MHEQERRDGADAPRSNNKPSRVAWPIRAVKRYLQKRPTEKQHESPTDRAARSTARATWVIAILTVVTIGVGVSQYVIFNGQLAEMKAAREGADKATAEQLAAMKDQTKAIGAQAGLMQGQLEVMKSDQRPWVGLAAIVPTDVPGAYEIRIQNFGKSPAFDVSINVDALPEAKGPQNLYKEGCSDQCLIRSVSMMPTFGISLRAPQLSRPNIDPTQPIWLMARIDYKDANGGGHETGICYIVLPDVGHSGASCPAPHSNYAN